MRLAARAGLHFVQVREKDLAGGALFELVREIVDAVAGTATRVLVNGRPDVARAAGAHGVQLPADGLPVAAVRAAFPELLVGASCHGAAEVLTAAREGASFAIVGPVFATPGKEARALGAGALAGIVRATALPIFAIGGIDAATVAAVRAAGARGRRRHPSVPRRRAGCGAGSARERRPAVKPPAMTSADVDRLYAEVLRAGENVAAQRRVLATHAPDALVLMSVLRRAVPRHLLEVLAAPPWADDARVQAGIVLNPRATVPLSLRVLPALLWRHLAAVALAPHVAGPVRVRAETVLREKVADLRLGDRVSLAKIATPPVMPLLLADAERRVADACLINPRLREEDLAERHPPRGRSACAPRSGHDVHAMVDVLFRPARGRAPAPDAAADRACPGECPRASRSASAGGGARGAAAPDRRQPAAASRSVTTETQADERDRLDTFLHSARIAYSGARSLE